MDVGIFRLLDPDHQFRERARLYMPSRRIQLTGGVNRESERLIIANHSDFVSS
jgi:hypothetical protein